MHCDNAQARAMLPSRYMARRQKDWWHEKMRSAERKPLPGSDRVVVWVIFVVAAISASAVIAAFVS
jgi:hypothetical protein